MSVIEVRTSKEVYALNVGETIPLYIREVSSFGDVRIRNRADADECLLRDEYRVGTVTQWGPHDSLNRIVLQKLEEIRC